MPKDSRSHQDTLDPRTEGLLAHIREDICGELLAINDYAVHTREAELLGLDTMASTMRQILASEKEHLAYHIRLLIENDPDQADMLARVFGAPPLDAAVGEDSGKKAGG